MRYKIAERNDQSMVNFKVDSVVKESAEAVLSGMGLNTSAYLGMCLRKLAQSRKIPFDLKVDPDFWVAEAQVSIAASYLKTGLFYEADHVRRGMLLAASNRITEATANLGEEAALHGEDAKKTHLMQVAMESLQGMLKSFDPQSPEQMLSFARGVHKIYEIDMLGLGESANLCTEPLSRISEDMEEILNDFFCSLETKEILKDLGLSVPPEDPTDRAEAVESYLRAVLDAYDSDSEQLSMRFVGSEFLISYAEKVANEMANARESLKEGGAQE